MPRKASCSCLLDWRDWMYFSPINLELVVQFYQPNRTTGAKRIMNKSELIDAIAAKTGVSKVSSGEVLDALMVVIKESLANGDNVQLVGFGTFAVTERAAREGRNPATGKALKIAAKKAVKFKVGKAMADAVAGVSK